MCKVVIITVTIEIALLAMAATILAAMMLLSGSGAAIGPEQPKKVDHSEAQRIVFNNTRQQHCKPYGEDASISCTSNSGNEYSHCCKTPQW